MAKEVTRRELYDLVWSVPKSTLAKDFGVSDVALAKACRKANIPTPGVGYWAKKEAGKKVVQGLLPERGLGMPETITIGREPYRQLTDAEVLAPIPEPPKFSEDMDAVRARVAAMLKHVTVPWTFDRAHAVVAKLLQEDEVRRQKQLGEKYPMSWNNPFFESPIERRRLRIINALFLAVTRAWARPYVSGRGAEGCGVVVGEQHVGFKLQPIAQSRGRVHASKSDSAPRLELVIQRYQGDDTRGRWEDTDDQQLESHVQEIAVELIVSGERQHRLNVAWQHKWRVERKEQREAESRRAEEERIRKERERLERLARERLDRLLAQVASLATAERIRDYVGRVLSLERESQRLPALEAWARWARAQADGIDPVLNRHFQQDLEREEAQS